MDRTGMDGMGMIKSRGDRGWMGKYTISAPAFLACAKWLHDCIAKRPPRLNIRTKEFTMPVNRSFIRNFLDKWETRQLRGYIPCRKRNFTGHNKAADCGEVIGQSGVTVGTGLDLGQQGEADLRRMRLDDAIINRFRAYLGKKRQDAVAALAAAPLTLSEAECDAVDDAVHGDYIGRAADLYDRHTEGLPFVELPQEAQAVIVSLYYQLGSPFSSRGHAGYPVLYRHLCRGDWQAAAHELQTGFRNYANRRADEGRLLGEVA